MRLHSIYVVVGTILLSLIGLSGCDSATKPTDDHAADVHEGEHEHGEEGPHGGHIIELGAEDYHAELTHDDEAHRIGIHFLGPDAKTARPIEAESVVINVSVDGEPSQYTLPATSQEGEAAGSSSYFEIVSEPLCAIVCGESEAERTHARLNVTIGGKPYVGLIETEPHEHDHGHDHAH